MIGTWLRTSIGVYFGNAAAMRDFRVQLRGNRAVVLWGVYLLILIGFTMLTYSSSASGYRTSIVQAQGQLRGFYQAIMILLAVMVNLIAPALTAGAIVTEKQRRSLDLVFSAPVTAKYYLVGKMISSYRYIWMLLILSVPVTSACVVLGGATWSDVIAAYIILSFNALIYTAIALLISTLSKQPVAAIIWSYTASILYSIVSGMVASASAIGSFSGMTRTQEAPFLITLNPYTVVQAAPTFTTIWGYQLPNWVLGAVAAVLFSKLLVLGAASAMSGYGAKETKGLRIHGLIYSFLIAAMYSYATLAATMMVSRAMSSSRGMGSRGLTPTGPSNWSPELDLTFGWIFMPLIILVPFLTCYGLDAERRFWPDGTFSLKGMINGTPSGGLPYIWGMVISAYLGYFLVHQQAGSPGPSLAILFWVLCFWTFFWSLGRLTSSLNMGLRSARALQFTISVTLVALPVPFFAAVKTFSGDSSGIWDFYILRPLLGGQDNRTIAAVYGILLLATSLLITFIAETKAAKKGVKARYAT